MVANLKLGDVTVDVVLKDIRNVHLSVYPPDGRVRIAAPEWMTLDSIRLFAVSKLEWIRRQQKELRGQERETAREYVERESHYVWGKRYLLEVRESEARASVEIRHRRMILSIRPGASEEVREALVERWYRDQLKQAIPSVLARWEPLMRVKTEGFYVQRMKTRWGSCNQEARTIRLNTELAKKPPECLEYLVVHELAHLIEPTHNARFVALMDRFMPQWRVHRDVLNRLPVRRENWSY
jgi:predicted metal-dependent hydrolase